MLKKILKIIGVIGLLYFIYYIMTLIAHLIAETFQPNIGDDSIGLLLNSWQMLLVFSASLILIKLGTDDSVDPKKVAETADGLRNDKRLQY